MTRLSNKKRYPIHGTDLLCSSKSEANVGNGLVVYGYKFIHDKKYPYEETNLQFDFMILNAKETAENFNPKSHHVFIEVKDDDTKYIDDLQEKRNLVNAHDDVLLVITDKDAKYLKENIEESINVKNIKGERNKLKYENIKLKNILKKNNIRY